MKSRLITEYFGQPSLWLGFIAAVLVAGISRGLALIIPQLGGGTIAILLGIVLGNLIGHQDKLDKGTKLAESKLLEISVVLLGATVTFQTIAEVGVKGVLYILLMMSGTILFTVFVGKKLGFSQTMSLLMAGGNAICGSSAIASIAPVIGAEDEEKGQIITLVNLLGTVMMLTLPFIGLGLFGESLLGKSALLGGTLQSVGQVVAGASLLSTDVVQYAMLFKIMRIMLLVVVVLIFEKWVTRSKEQVSTLQSENKRRRGLPWYVTGFLLLCIVNSLITLPHVFSETAHFVSGWFEITALAAIGLRLNLKKFLKEGPKFLIYGASVGCFQTVTAIVLIFLLIK